MPKKRILYVVENDNDKLTLLEKLRGKVDTLSIIVVDYLGWDFLIPQEIYRENRECFHKFFDACNRNSGEEWFFGNTSSYDGYAWVRYVDQKDRSDLKDFLFCITQEYEIREFPPVSRKPETPSVPPNKKKEDQEEKGRKMVKRCSGLEKTCRRRLRLAISSTKMPAEEIMSHLLVFVSLIFDRKNAYNDGNSTYTTKCKGGDTWISGNARKRKMMTLFQFLILSAKPCVLLKTEWFPNSNR